MYPARCAFQKTNKSESRVLSMQTNTKDFSEFNCSSSVHLVPSGNVSRWHKPLQTHKRPVTIGCNEAASALFGLVIVFPLPLVDPKRYRDSHQRRRNTTIADGNGAHDSAPTNRIRFRKNRISPFIAQSCHHAVSVLAGTKHTTTSAVVCDDSNAFCIQSPMTRPYGGFIQHRPDHSCFNPSISGVKYFSHLAFSGNAQTSKVK